MKLVKITLYVVYTSFQRLSIVRRLIHWYLVCRRVGGVGPVLNSVIFMSL